MRQVKCAVTLFFATIALVASSRAHDLIEASADSDFVKERFLAIVDTKIKQLAASLDPVVYHPDVKIYTRLSNGGPRYPGELSSVVGRTLSAHDIELGVAPIRPDTLRVDNCG